MANYTTAPSPFELEPNMEGIGIIERTIKAAEADVYRGALLNAQSSALLIGGAVVHASNTAGQVFMGVAVDDGAGGDNIRVVRDGKAGPYTYSGGGLDSNAEGNLVYCGADDNTVAGTGHVLIGTIYRVNNPTGGGGAGDSVTINVRRDFSGASYDRYLTDNRTRRNIILTYNYTLHGGAVSTIDLGGWIPAAAIITSVVSDTLTALASTGAPKAGLALKRGSDILISATAYDNADWTGVTVRPTLTGPKIASAGAVSLTITNQALTAGKVNFIIEWIMSST